jgi:capsular exopolysaccharide synthesis family protein
MEKIKVALERARKARLGVSPHDNARNSRKPDPARRKTVQEKITYTKTKIIDSDNNALNEKGIIIGNDDSIENNAYKVLRTHVLQRMRQNGWSMLGITSPTAGNGKTLTAINLAVSLAREVNQTVLLVDFDLRRPSIHKLFSIPDHPGVSQYIQDNTELSEILFNPGMDRLVVLPGKDPISNSSEMLSSPKIVKLVEELKTYYAGRLILFDLPPILSCDDVLAFAPYTDCIMLVVEDCKTKKNELIKATELIKKDKLIGTVLNKSKQDVKNLYYV